MEEHDIVILKEDLKDVPQYTEGTIIHIYNDIVCEVEFEVGEEIILKTLSFLDIELAPKPNL